MGCILIPPNMLRSSPSPPTEGGEGRGEEGRRPWLPSPRPSALWGENSSKQDFAHSTHDRAADSPSPLNGERAGVRGEKVREASSLERRFMGSPDAIFSAHWDHEPACASPSPLNGERAGVRGEKVR